MKSACNCERSQGRQLDASDKEGIGLRPGVISTTAAMNGFAEHGLDEDAFGDKKGGFVQAFDAFRMSTSWETLCSRADVK